MERYVLKITDVMNRTLSAIDVAQKEHNKVFAGMMWFRIKIHALLILEFIFKLLAVSFVAFGVSYMSGMRDVGKYFLIIDAICILGYIVYYDLRYNHVSEKGIDGEMAKNQNIINALHKFTHTSIGQMFPNIFISYLRDLKEMVRKSQACTSGLRKIGNSLSILTFGFIQTMFNIPDDKMLYYNTSEAELKRSFDELPTNFKEEYKLALEEIKTISTMYDHNSAQYSALLLELGSPLNVAVLQRLCREKVISKEDLSKYIDLKPDVEKLLFEAPIQTEFIYSGKKKK